MLTPRHRSYRIFNSQYAVHGALPTSVTPGPRPAASKVAGARRTTSPHRPLLPSRERTENASIHHMQDRGPGGAHLLGNPALTRRPRGGLQTGASKVRGVRYEGRMKQRAGMNRREAHNLTSKAGLSPAAASNKSMIFGRAADRRRATRNVQARGSARKYRGPGRPKSRHGKSPAVIGDDTLDRQRAAASAGQQSTDQAPVGRSWRIRCREIAPRMRLRRASVAQPLASRSQSPDVHGAS